MKLTTLILTWHFMVQVACILYWTQNNQSRKRMYNVYISVSRQFFSLFSTVTQHENVLNWCTFLLSMFRKPHCHKLLILHWRIQGAHPACAPLRDPILSFWHTNFMKCSRLGSPRPPTRSSPPPTGNPGSATILSHKTEKTRVVYLVSFIYLTSFSNLEYCDARIGCVS